MKVLHEQVRHLKKILGVKWFTCGFHIHQYRERVLCVSRRYVDRSKHETCGDQVARLVGHVLWIRDTDRPFRCAAHTICSSQRSIEKSLTVRTSAVDLWVTCESSHR